jgi:hypothetical protein
MGAQFMFDEVVTSNDNRGKKFECTVEVLDNHSVPEVRIGPKDAAYQGWIAEFDNWEQFTRFVEAVNALHRRLEQVQK